MSGLSWITDKEMARLERKHHDIAMYGAGALKREAEKRELQDAATGLCHPSRSSVLQVRRHAHRFGSRRQDSG